MGVMDDLAGVLKQAASGNAPTTDVHAAYDQKTIGAGALALLMSKLSASRR